MKMQNVLVASALVCFLLMATVVPKMSLAAHVGLQEASQLSTDETIKSIRKMLVLPSQSAKRRRRNKKSWTPPSPTSSQGPHHQSSPPTPVLPLRPPPPPPCYGPVPSNHL